MHHSGLLVDNPGNRNPAAKSLPARWPFALISSFLIRSIISSSSSSVPCGLYPVWLSFRMARDVDQIAVNIGSRHIIVDHISVFIVDTE